MKKPIQIRQGDILIERVDKLPKNLIRQKPENGRIILAHGEVTGHHHSLAADPADWWKDGQGNQYLTINKFTPVEHQEHSMAPLEAGFYRVLRQREYTPEEIRNVAD